jgi:hypothetical protein
MIKSHRFDHCHDRTLEVYLQRYENVEPEPDTFKRDFMYEYNYYQLGFW